MIAAPRLEARDLHFSYGHGDPAIAGVSFALEPGSTVALIGQNGSGKTTLAKLLGGLSSPQRGQVLLDGNDIGPQPSGRIARSVGFVFQNPDHQIFSPTVYDEVAFGPRNLGWDQQAVAEAVEEALARFKLSDYTDQPPASLSFGLRRKVTVAAVQAMRPPILILDEPTLGLDPRSSEQLMATLVDQSDGGRTLLFITHDMTAVARFAQRCLLLQSGQIAADRPTADLLGDEQLLRENRLEAPPVVRLRLHLEGHDLPHDALSVESLTEALATRLRQKL